MSKTESEFRGWMAHGSDSWGTLCSRYGMWNERSASELPYLHCEYDLVVQENVKRLTGVVPLLGL